MPSFVTQQQQQQQIVSTSSVAIVVAEWQQQGTHTQIYVYIESMTKMGKKQICAKNYNERSPGQDDFCPGGHAGNSKGSCGKRLTPLPAATRWHFTAAQSASASASQSFGCQLASCYLLQFKWLGIAIYCCLLEAWTTPSCPPFPCRLIPSTTYIYTEK